MPVYVNGLAHYNVCTYFGMPIKLFLIRIWPRPPPPFSSGIQTKKNFENYGRPLISLKLSGSFKPVAQGVPEIFHEMYLAGGTICPLLGYG